MITEYNNRRIKSNMMNRNIRILILFLVGCIVGYFLPNGLEFMKRRHCNEKKTDTSVKLSYSQQHKRGEQKRTLKHKKLIFAGVMTAEKFLDTRAKTVYLTWGQKLPGKLMFFASSTSKRKDLPVVSLKNVDDSYPPQRKSMMMLKYMHDNYINDYEWFLRSDDDVYVRTDKLEKFLRTLNSSDDLYIGQAGTGTKIEKGLLGLGYGDNFCMGGPGVIISAGALRKVTPYLEYCLQNLVTTHEDVEVGRCIKNFVGVSCTWAFEMQSLFYHNQSKDLAYTGELHTKSVHNAITLHPLKKPEYMYRLHSHFKEVELRDKAYHTTKLERILATLDTLLSKGVFSVPAHKLALLNDRKDFHQNMLKSDSPIWEMFTPRKIYSFTTNAPEIGMLVVVEITVGYHLGGETFQSVTLRKCLLQGDNRPLFRPLDCVVLAIYNGMIDPVKVGMNGVLSQTMFIINKEARKVLHRTLEFKRLNHGYERYHPIYGVQFMLDLLMKYHRHIGRNRRRMTVHVRHHAYLQQPFADLVFSTDKRKTNEVIHFLLPLAGRLPQFEKFLKTYEMVCLKHKEKTSLLILYFTEVSSPNDHQKLFNKLKEKYPKADLKWIDMNGRFSRSLALTVGASQYSKNSLLFFCDVDIVFNLDFLTRCRTNSEIGRLIYYPVVFSQYAPEMAFYNESQASTSFYYSKNAGGWRKYGFGITCQYRSDFDSIGGFDTTIQGWGMEDVDLYNRYIRSYQHTVFRAIDPGLVHIYHEVKCDMNLAEKQLIMCLTSKAQSFGSESKLQGLIYDQGLLTT